MQVGAGVLDKSAEEVLHQFGLQIAYQANLDKVPIGERRPAARRRYAACSRNATGSRAARLVDLDADHQATHCLMIILVRQVTHPVCRSPQMILGSVLRA